MQCYQSWRVCCLQTALGASLPLMSESIEDFFGADSKKEMAGSLVVHLLTVKSFAMFALVPLS